MQDIKFIKQLQAFLDKNASYIEQGMQLKVSCEPKEIDGKKRIILTDVEWKVKKL